MSKVLVTDAYLSAIAAAIRSKNGEITLYKPSEMAAAIAAIPSGSSAVLESLSVTANGTYTPGAGVDGYNSVAVNVPNSYAASDEGKVVSNGTLVAQTARAAEITQNGTYDTTLYNSIVVDISGGGGSLPDTYQAVEYLENNDGNAAIALGMNIMSALKIELDFQLSSVSSLNIYCGARGLSFGHNASSVIFATNSSGASRSSTTIGLGRHQIVWNKTMTSSVSFELDGAPAVSLPLSYSSSYDLGLYVMSGYPTNSGIGLVGRLYSAKVYDFDQVIIRNLIPCYDRSTQTPGLYDLARGAFYTNAGTGALTVGPDVE